MFDTNVKATFFLTQALLPKPRDGGSIINTSSTVSAAASGRIGTPDDIAPPVTFLASPARHRITGQCIQANGGIHL